MYKYLGILLWALLLILAGSPVFAQKANQIDSLSIGLLISDASFSDAQRGAELAIVEANNQNFLNGKKVKLMTRSMEGPWGTGAKQTVDLVFNQNVWAIVGSHDGRNAHLAEQVIAKTQVVYISAWSGDPTLAQAYVPWFFSMVSNNIQQAKSLFSEINSNGKPERLLVLSDSTYDAENALKYFMQEMNEHQLAEPMKLRYKSTDFNLTRQLMQIKDLKPKTIVLFGKPKESVIILKSLQTNAVQAKIYGTFETLGEDPENKFEIRSFKGAIVPDTNFAKTENGKKFIKSYTEEYGQEASPTAAYAYDAVWLLLKKIKESGFDREAFKTRMRNTNETGVTGTIQFDSIGNRKQNLNWIRIQ